MLFGWTLERTEAGLDALERALGQAGLRLHRLKGAVRIERSATAVEPGHATLTRYHHARRGLTLGEARTLSGLINGELHVTRLSNPQRVALARLRTARLATRDEQPELTEDVRYSLMLG
jgi:hypothetical protein